LDLSEYDLNETENGEKKESDFKKILLPIENSSNYALVLKTLNGEELKKRFFSYEINSTGFQLKIVQRLFF